jgi:hypothetical protein
MTDLKMGKIVASYTDYNSAKEAAKDRSGNEIIANIDGEFAVISLTEEETRIWRAANNQGENTDSLIFGQKLNEGKGSLAVIDLHVDGKSDDDIEIKVKLAEKKQVRDVEGVGNKIQAAFFKNGNRFLTVGAAQKAAEGLDFNVAIIKNDNGSFSLYNVSQDQFASIMSDKKYSGKVEVFSGSFGRGRDVYNPRETGKDDIMPVAGSSGREKREKELDNMTRESLQETKLNLSEKDAGNLKKQAGFGQVTEQTADNPAVNDALETIANFSRSTARPTMEDLNKVEAQVNFLLEFNAKGSLKLPGDDLAKLEKLKTSIENSKASLAKLELATKEFNAGKLRAKNQAVEMGRTLDNLEANAKTPADKKAIIALRKIIANYDKVLDSNDPARIALYEAYMKRVQQFLDNKEYNNHPPVKLSDLQKEYNEIRKILVDADGSGEITEKDKQKAINKVREWAGEKSSAVQITAKSLDKYKVVPPDQVSASNANSEPETELDDEGCYDGSCTVFDNQDLRNGFHGFQLDVAGLAEKMEMAAEDYDESINELINLADEVMDGLSDALDYYWKVPETDTVNLAPEIPFSFKIEKKDVPQSIADLLKKFREIIVDLDLNTREVAYKEISAKMIDKAFADYLKNNYERLRNQNETGAIMQQLFKESTEVNDSQLPFAIKQMKQTDILKKMALVALLQLKKIGF